MLMVDHSMTTRLIDHSETSGYNKIYRHQWRTFTNALPMIVHDHLNILTEGRPWGWYFIPHENMDYRDPNWFENQTLILSFDDEYDLIQAKLEVSNLL